MLENDVEAIKSWSFTTKVTVKVICNGALSTDINGIIYIKFLINNRTF